MKWILKEETETKRLYVQDQTGSQLTTEVLITDKTGVKWWGFSDLFKAFGTCFSLRVGR
jgi:hypothetical protein